MNLLSLIGLRLDNIYQIRRKWYYSSEWNFFQSKHGLGTPWFLVKAWNGRLVLTETVTYSPNTPACLSVCGVCVGIHSLSRVATPFGKFGRNIQTHGQCRSCADPFNSTLRSMLLVQLITPKKALAEDERETTMVDGVGWSLMKAEGRRWGQRRRLDELASNLQTHFRVLDRGVKVCLVSKIFHLKTSYRILRHMYVDEIKN
jgi:hypothetical protein